MPKTAKGLKIFKNMVKEYGPEKGKNVFYASENKGTIKGVTKDGPNRRKSKSKKKRS